jgi:hypothetical protein
MQLARPDLIIITRSVRYCSTGLRGRDGEAREYNAKRPLDKRDFLRNFTFLQRP